MKIKKRLLILKTKIKFSLNDKQRRNTKQWEWLKHQTFEPVQYDVWSGLGGKELTKITQEHSVIVLGFFRASELPISSYMCLNRWYHYKEKTAIWASTRSPMLRIKASMRQKTEKLSAKVTGLDHVRWSDKIFVCKSKLMYPVHVEES